MSEDDRRKDREALEPLAEKAGLPRPDWVREINNMGRAAGLKVVPEDGAPIVLVQADLNQTALRIGEVVQRLDLFQLNGELVIFDDDGEALKMCDHLFRTWINEHIVVAAKYEKDGRALPTTLKLQDAKSILMSQSFLGCVRKVKGVNKVRLPVIRKREDGDKLELLPKGYDEKTKYFTAKNALEYKTDLDLDAAKGWYRRQFGEFPFGEEGDRRGFSVQLAGMLALFTRHLLDSGALRKGFLWIATKPDSGKSVLAKACIYPVLGHAAAAKLKRDADLDKEMEAFQRNAVSYIFLDNVYGSLRSSTIDQIITSKESTFRSMGGHGVVRVKNGALLLVTGNQLELNEDAKRRFVVIDLHREDDPSDHTPTHLLDDSVMESAEWRAEALGALYAFVRNWFEAGRPNGPTIDNTFSQFTALLGGIVVAAGYDDPFEKIELPSTRTEKDYFRDVMSDVYRQMELEGEDQREWTVNELAIVARELGVLQDKVGTTEDGIRLNVTKNRLDREEAKSAVDLGGLDKAQATKWGRFVSSQAGQQFKVGDGVRIQLGDRKSASCKTYTVVIHRSL